MNLIEFYKNNGYLRPLEIYIHIPFCEKKCLYCDFLSFSDKNIFIEEYFNKLYDEIIQKSKYYNMYDIVSIFIGGGTPSVVDDYYIKKIIKLIKENYNIINNVEISIECNPHSAIKEKLEKYKEYGINRLSIGLQSTNNNELQSLGRIHTYEDFLITYESALRLKYENINVDLMYGIPNQTITTWKSTLQTVLKLKPKHISAYNLIIEEGTPYFDLYKNKQITLPSEDDILVMDIETENLLKEQKIFKYEISNYSKENFECKHNLGYWSDIPYLGFGLGSSSYIQNIRYRNISSFIKYINLNYNLYSNDNINNYYDEIKELNTNELMDEFLMLGLRKIDGVSCTQFRNKFKKELREVYTTKLDYYLTNSLIIHDKDNYKFSKRGMNISNKILSDLLFN